IIGPHTSRHIDRGLIAKEVRAVADSGALGVKIMGGHHPSSPEATEAMIEVANREDCYVAYHVGTTDSSSNLEGMRELPHIVGSNRLHLAHVNAYMRGMVRPIYEELAEGLEIIRQLKSVVSESHLAPFNGTSGAVDGDQLLDQVTVNCLRMAGYVPNRRGLEEALRDGYAAVNVPQDGRMVHLNGETGHRRWRELDGNCGLSFPVNRRITAMACALERRAGGEGEAGEFLIDALASDGGAWRNELLSRGLPLVEFGALSLQELVQKISTNPAKMFGFASKGTLREGSDADLTIVDVARRNVVATVVAGETVAREGRVLGEGGNLYTTDRGREALRRAGWISHMVDLAESSFYKKSVTTGEPGAGIE
ncbi:MAG: amidohydrolase family protein, partial [Bacillota bacterium]